eukprot:TRINITY_DN36557_c0_g1_i1.p1 TRINITY_DN36557_c0_g1~~TRINITY_DN36557_c0_g1_i1.p1  ORF type:complete len:666 (+),score=165.10 TRINITY_DN36557_c0_g1_i1:38-2035(+)
MSAELSASQWRTVAVAALGVAVVQAFHLAKIRRRLSAEEQSASPADTAPLDRPSAPSEERQAQEGAIAIKEEDERQHPAEEPQRFALRTLLEALRVSDRVNSDSIEGPYQLNPGEEVPVACFQFKMSHFECKAYLAHGADEGSQHLKLQTVFEDNRNSLVEAQGYYVANEWNTSKAYTRLKCGSTDRGRSNVYTLEYDLLCPTCLPHSYGLQLLLQSLRMWYTSMMACVMHIVVPRGFPFATHAMIVANTLVESVREEDVGLKDEACPICLECFQPGEKVRRLPCMHVFHVVGADAGSCQSRHCNIDRHLVVDKTCPVCKTPIDIMERLERQPASQSGGSAEASSGTRGAARETLQVEDAALAVQSTPADAAAQAIEQSSQQILPHLRQSLLNEASAPAPVPPPDDRPAPDAAADASAGEQQQPAEASQAPTSVNTRSQVRLPEQAEELERVVRGLQSRWLQIQDMVASMQQMLRYIEDGQSTLGNRREGANGGEQIVERQASAQQQQDEHLSDSPPVPAPEVQERAEEEPAGRSPAQQPEGQPETLAAHAAAPEPGEQLPVPRFSPLEQLQPRLRERLSHLVPAMLLPEEGASAAAAAVEPQEAPTARSVERVPEDDRGATPAAAPARWQHFTTAEKVYSAYAWRRRRLAMLQAAASSAGNSAP